MLAKALKFIGKIYKCELLKVCHKCYSDLFKF